MRWTRDTPATDGWYWMKYRGKDGTVMCPAKIVHIDAATLVRSARNDTFIEGPGHGGPGLKYDGKTDKSIRFWPEPILGPPATRGGTVS